MKATKIDNTEDWRERIKSIIAFSEDIIFDTKGLSKKEFLSPVHRSIRKGAQQDLIHLGEETKFISNKIRKRYPKVDWSGMVGLRCILSHEEKFINYEKMWKAVHIEIPKLIVMLREILEETSDLSS